METRMEKKLSPVTDESSGGIEALREKLAEQVRLNLEKCKEQITNFNFGTVFGPEMNSLNNFPNLKYDDRFKDKFKTHNMGEGSGKIEGNGYIYLPEAHYITYEASLGLNFRPGDFRSGNKFVVTITFDKNGNIENEKELIDSISKLLETIIPYYVTQSETVSEMEEKHKTGSKNIAKEGLPVLKAFKEIAEKYEKGQKMQTIINEYENVLKK